MDGPAVRLRGRFPANARIPKDRDETLNGRYPKSAKDQRLETSGGYYGSTLVHLRDFVRQGSAHFRGTLNSDGARSEATVLVVHGNDAQQSLVGVTSDSGLVALQQERSDAQR